MRIAWNRRKIVTLSAPFVAVMLLAFATIPISDVAGRTDFVVAAAALTVAIAVGILVLPWSRLPRAVVMLPAFGGLVVIALLRHAEHGGTSGYGVLVFVPVLWLALYGTRIEMIAMIIAVAALFIVPVVAVGAPDYPDSEWRRAALFAVLTGVVGIVTQNLVFATRARAAEAERTARHDRERETYLRTVMDTAYEGIAAIDTEGNPTFVNPAAAAMYGYSLDELRGRGMHELIHHSRPDGTHYPAEECPMLATVRTGRECIVSNEVFWRKDGSSFPVEYHAAAMTEAGRIIGAVVTFTDISERIAVERIKDEFVSVVSHELRTPLTSIRGSLGLMEGGVLGELSDEAKRMLSIAISSTDRLVRLINDILDVQRIESGNVRLEIRSCDLDELMKSTRELLEPSAAQADVELHFRPVGVRLEADPDRIIQVLVNLIGNAIKFSPRGGTVTIDGERHDGRVRVRVRDQGPGIPEEKRKAIFDRFVQADSADARQKGGSGLGLAIARGIVEQHGGGIWVESADGEGSTFAFELPVGR